METSPVDQAIERAEREVASQRLWRAKEILQGNLGRHPAEARLYEAYGRVLLMMGDKVEAGKYLFISGVREAQYREALELFRARYAKDRRTLLSSLPKTVRGLAPDRLPTNVREELAVLGVPSTPEPVGRLPLFEGRRLDDRSERLMGLGCMAGAAVAMILMLVGLVTVVGFVFRLFG